MLSNKQIGNRVYLMDKISSMYIKKHRMTMNKFLELDKDLDILGHISRHSYMFDDMTDEEMLDEVEEYIDAEVQIKANNISRNNKQHR